MNFSHPQRSAALLVVAALLLFSCRGSATDALQPKQTTKPASPPAGLIRLDELTGVRDAEEKRHDEIRKILKQKVSGDFSKLTIEQAMSRLSNKGELFPVDFGQDGSGKFRVRDGMKFDSVTRREVLRKILRTEDAALEFSLENGGLKISFGFDDSPQLFTRSYPINDLAFPQASRRARRANPTSVIGGFRFGSLSSTEPSDFDWLVAEIKNATSGPWRSDEGIGGTMVIVNDVARIRQTEKNHAEIRALLAAVRAAAKGRLRGNMLYLHAEGNPAVADVKIIKLWSRPVSIEISKRPLEQAVAEFSRATGIPMRLAKADLANEGVDLKSPITFRAQDRRVFRAATHVEPPRTPGHFRSRTWRVDHRGKGRCR